MISTNTADLKNGKQDQGHAKNDAKDSSKGFIVKFKRRSSGQSAATGKGIVTGQAAETNEVVLDIFVVGILQVEMVLVLLAMEQGVVVLEKRRRVVGGGFGVAQTRRTGERLSKCWLTGVEAD